MSAVRDCIFNIFAATFHFGGRSAIRNLRTRHVVRGTHSTIIVRVMRWAGHVTRMGENRGVRRILVGKPKGKGPLGRHRCIGEDNIKIDFQEEGCEVIDWIELAQDRDRWRALVNAVMNLRVP